MALMLCVAVAAAAVAATGVWLYGRRAYRNLCADCLVPIKYLSGPASAHLRCRACGEIVSSPEIPPRNHGPRPPAATVARFAHPDDPDHAIVEVSYREPRRKGDQGTCNVRVRSPAGAELARQLERAHRGKGVRPDTQLPPPYRRSVKQLREALMRGYVLTEPKMIWIDEPQISIGPSQMWDAWHEGKREWAGMRLTSWPFNR